MSDTAISCPYAAGEVIDLTLAYGQAAKATIVEVKTMTMACVMVVQLTPDAEPQILKLYDRRFGVDLREYHADPWDAEIEAEYQELIQNGERDKLFATWSAGYAESPWYKASEGEDDWDSATAEAYVHFHSELAYEAEKHAYDLMSDMQGRDIPRFEGTVTAMLPANEQTKFDFSCPGILLQYINPGFELTELAANLPQELWQGIFDEAIRINYEVGERGIANSDVGQRSFIVCTDPALPHPQVFMLDFGQCKFRDRMQDEHQFREYQAHQDEEGAVAYMVTWHKKFDGVLLQYTESERRRRLQYDFRRAEVWPKR